MRLNHAFIDAAMDQCGPFVDANAFDFMLMFCAGGEL